MMLPGIPNILKAPSCIQQIAVIISKLEVYILFARVYVHTDMHSNSVFLFNMNFDDRPRYCVWVSFNFIVIFISTRRMI